VNYKVTSLGRKVWVRLFDVDKDEYFAIGKVDAVEISDWVTLTGIGYRVAYDRWQLDSKQAVMMFTLRWN